MAIVMRTKKICKDCGQTLRKMVQAVMGENGPELIGDYGWFHQNNVCKKEKKKQ